jgi:hypothetical protein
MKYVDYMEMREGLNDRQGSKLEGQWEVRRPKRLRGERYGWARSLRKAFLGVVNMRDEIIKRMR